MMITIKKILPGGPGGALAAALIWRRDKRKSLFLDQNRFLGKMKATIEFYIQKLRKLESFVKFEAF